MADDGELVESGTFRVDRQRALEKLKDFQLSDPTMFLLPWIRCAVASGATGIRLTAYEGGWDDHINTDGGLLKMSFDGRPFTEKELKDPYNCLFEETTQDNARNRNFAIGILSALRLNPSSVTVYSGIGHGRVRLDVESLESEVLTPIEGSDTITTVLRVEWPYFVRSSFPAGLMQHVCDNHLIWLCPLQIGGQFATHVSPDHRPLQRYQLVPHPNLQSEDKTVRGWITVSSDHDRGKSTIRLYNYGVYVETVELDMPFELVEADINDDQFILNVSQSGVVRNARFEQTMKLTQTQIERLVLGGSSSDTKG